MLPELIDYLSKGPCLVVVGAGLSSEIGLPDWRGLAEDVLEALRKANPKDLEAAELDFAQNNFPALLGRAWRGVSPSFVLEACKKVLTDTGKSGSGYRFVVKFPFKGYLTTNLENILARHFKDASIAITLLGNSKADLNKLILTLFSALSIFTAPSITLRGWCSPTISTMKFCMIPALTHCDSS